jgi:CubicO group peptidase (beta-lactamase class C family)
MMRKISSFIILSFFLFSQNTYSDVIDNAGVRWPVPSWSIAQNKKERMSSKQCQDFIKFSTNSNHFLTEGLVVIKDGEIQFEHYDSKHNANTPHILWSVTKTITGALLGIAVRDGKISLDQGLNEFYPRPRAGNNYQKIKIENLFYLDTGFIWNEYYSGDASKSPVLNMLYYLGHKDIANYATDQQIISQGPGYKFNYSTGTPAITMGVLKKVYGDDYDQMPWTSLFKPLGMTNVRFERDHKGVFNGGSSGYATPREMAKLGYLYLNNGMWNGEEILPLSWIEKTTQVSPGYLSNGTVIRNITDDGVYGGSIWLNRPVKKGFGKPYPASPENMLLAMGHYGQILTILPTQKMVIARTGYDQEYNSKLDEFVSRAIACFDDPTYPIGKNIPPPDYTKITWPAIYKTLKSGLRTNVLFAAVAKTVCSCHFISGIDVDTCVDRSNVPLITKLAKISVRDNVVIAEQTKYAKILVAAYGRWPGEKSYASYDRTHPEFGCTLK